MRIAILTTDNREHYGTYDDPVPSFGTAPEALLQGFAGIPGVELHVVSCARHPMRSPEKLADNIWFHSLLVPKIGWMSTAYQGCIRAVRRKLNAIQPAIVHGQGTERECAMGAVFSGFPNVLTIHGNMAELARMFRARPGSYGWLAARLEGFCLRRTAGVFCNSAYTENLVRPRARRVWAVPNALRNRFFIAPAAPAAGSRPCVLLNVGIISVRKRQLELLGVARELHRLGLEFQMHFIGAAPESPYTAEFHRQIKPLEAGGRARHFGLMGTEELVRHFDGTAGLVHFPSEEAFGLVAAEGMARELKFFGARVGGLIDIAAGVPDAELFDLGDASGLTAAIARWIRNGHPRTRQAATIMAARYHPAVVARRHLEIYQEVLSTPS